jgi:flagellar motor protein MotB
MAVAIAESRAAADAVNPRLREARVALDSMEQLLRRSTPLDIVLSYANDAIRLGDMALLQDRATGEEERLRDATRRIRDLESELGLAREDRDRSQTRERDASGRINDLLSEVESVRGANRALTLERDGVARDLGRAEDEIRNLSDPWPPLARALVYGFGARETPRGLVLTLPSSAFGGNGPEPETREWLSRMAGMLQFGETPEIWVEGHSGSDAGAGAAEARAAAVRDYLIQAGLPEPLVFARGLGNQAPIPGAAEGGTPELNERVEIVVREFGVL